MNGSGMRRIKGVSNASTGVVLESSKHSITLKYLGRRK